jgi:exonuclease sbcD
LNLTGEEILVISIGIKNNEYINLENLENIAENNGALKTHILIKNILSIENSEEGTSDLSIEELEKNLISNWNISNIEKFSASFSELKELFSNNDRDSFLELFDKTLEVNEDDN